MDKALKKEDNRNIMENLAKEVGIKIAYDGESLAVTYKSFKGINTKAAEDVSRGREIKVNTKYKFGAKFCTKIIEKKL